LTKELAMRREQTEQATGGGARRRPSVEHAVADDAVAADPQRFVSPAAEAFVRRAETDRIRPVAVVIGCSTGGPAGLTTILESITVPLDIPILVVQHMPPRFTNRFATNLNSRVETRVVEATHGTTVEGGTCYIAPGAQHMEVRQRGGDEIKLIITNGPPVTFCKPSVEKLFGTAADHLGNRILAVMLTGMGRDGVVNAAKIAQLGSPVIAQDEESSTVWGMPKAVVESGAATDVLHLDEIGPRITKIATVGFRKKKPQRS
jgi:two-component system chemotaxis response regulator CheB